VIAEHIIALFGAKILAYTKHDPSKLVIDLEKIDEKAGRATFIHTSSPGITASEGPGADCESRYALSTRLDVHIFTFSVASTRFSLIDPPPVRLTGLKLSVRQVLSV